MADTSDVMVAIRYIFIISVILVLVAYYAGTVKVGTAFGQQLTNLVSVSTGRNPTTGAFAAYPTGA
jgi:hypothetical protein